MLHVIVYSTTSTAAKMYKTEQRQSHFQVTRGRGWRLHACGPRGAVHLHGLAGCFSHHKASQPAQRRAARCSTMLASRLNPVLQKAWTPWVARQAGGRPPSRTSLLPGAFKCRNFPRTCRPDTMRTLERGSHLKSRKRRALS